MAEQIPSKNVSVSETQDWLSADNSYSVHEGHRLLIATQNNLNGNLDLKLSLGSDMAFTFPPRLPKQNSSRLVESW